MLCGHLKLQSNTWSHRQNFTYRNTRQYIVTQRWCRLLFIKCVQIFVSVPATHQDIEVLTHWRNLRQVPGHIMTTCRTFTRCFLNELLTYLMYDFVVPKDRSHNFLRPGTFLFGTLEELPGYTTYINFKRKIWTWTGIRTRTSRSLAWRSAIELSWYSYKAVWSMTLPAIYWSLFIIEIYEM